MKVGLLDAVEILLFPCISLGCDTNNAPSVQPHLACESLAQPAWSYSSLICRHCRLFPATISSQADLT